MEEPVNTEGQVIEECLTAAIDITKEGDKDVAIRVPCKRIIENCCTVYRYPAKKWLSFACPFSQKEVTAEQERKLNPLKASKRAAKKK
jgi:hypothetical protein